MIGPSMVSDRAGREDTEHSLEEVAAHSILAREKAGTARRLIDTIEPLTSGIELSKGHFRLHKHRSINALDHFAAERE